MKTKTMMNSNVVSVETEQMNAFYDPDKASNGGGYDQPRITVTFADGGKVVILDSSCGDFGERVDAEYTSASGEVLARYALDTMDAEPYENGDFYKFPEIAEAVRAATGYRFPVNHEICILLSVEEGVGEETAEELEALTEKSVTTFDAKSFQEAREKSREYIADEVENLGFCAVMSRETEAVDVYDGCVDGQFIAEFYGFDAP